MLTALCLLLLPPQVDRNVIYSRVEPGPLRMDIYRPEGVVTRPTAAVVVIHGGAWIFGDRGDMSGICKKIAAQGMLAATIDYRLAPKTRWPGFYDDVQTAVRYLRLNATKLNIDPNRIGACGASAGGHLALMLGCTETRNAKCSECVGPSSRVSAVLDFFGPTDMSRDFPKSYDTLFMAVLGKPRDQAAAEIRAASPVCFLDRKTAPVFIVHGNADPVVPVAQSRWLEARLRSNGTRVEARYIDGMKHELPSSNAMVKKAINEGITWLKATLNR